MPGGVAEPGYPFVCRVSDVMKLSVLVPMRNEAAQLSVLLPALQRLQRQGHEVILVDGGSTDGCDHLAACAGLTVLHAPAGRARQMNAGAQHASGEALLFLHADTVLPDNACETVLQALTQSGRVWGRFDVCITGQHPMLAVVGRLMNLRSRLTGIATGDQALFMTRHAFTQVGGFPDQPLMEDIEISARLRRIAWPVCLRACVHTSGRRWESRGVWRTIVLMWRLRWQYWRGVSAQQLARAYR